MFHSKTVKSDSSELSLEFGFSAENSIDLAHYLVRVTRPSANLDRTVTWEQATQYLFQVKEADPAFDGFDFEEELLLERAGWQILIPHGIYPTTWAPR